MRKKKEVDEGQEEYTPVEESAAGEAPAHGKKACRRTLDFEDVSFKPEKEKIQHRDETGPDNREKQDQDLQDCHMAVPSTPKRKRSQPRRMGKGPVKINESQATKRRQGKEPTSDIYISGRQYEAMFEYKEAQLLSFQDWTQKGMRSQTNPNTSFAGKQLVAQEEDVSALNLSCYGYGYASQAGAGRVITFQGRQSIESTVRLDKIDTPTKKRTTGHARFRGSSSINKAKQVNNSNVLAKTSSRKKRTTKSQKSQTNQLTLLPKHCQFPPSFASNEYIQPL